MTNPRNEKWRPLELGEIIDIFDSIRMPLNSQQRAERQGAYPYYGASGIIDGIDDFLFDGEYVLVAEDGENLNSRKLPVAFMARGKFWVNNHAHIIKGKKGIADDRFLIAWFAQADIKGYITGAAQPKLSQANLKRIALTAPPYSTQRKIASILSAYDDLIENNTRRIAILEEMAQAIYREWFVNFRFPGHENVKLVESTLGMIPEAWKAATLGSCSRVIPGYAFKSSDWQEFGVPVVKIKNITDNNCVDMESADCVSASLITDRMQKFMLETGDLLVAMTGATAGKAGVLRMRDPCALNQRVAKISPKDGFRSLLWCFLVGNRQLIFNLADGAAQPNMSGGQIESFPVLIPSENVLSNFESSVANIAQLADSLYFKNRNLRTTRDLLLPKLISGKLEVEDLDIDLGPSADELQESTA